MPKGYVGFVSVELGFGIIKEPEPPFRYIPFPEWEAQNGVRAGDWVSYDLSNEDSRPFAKHVRVISPPRPLPSDPGGCPRCGAEVDIFTRTRSEGRNAAGALLPWRSKLYAEIYLILECTECSWKEPDQLVMIHDQGRPKTVWPWIAKRFL